MARYLTVEDVAERLHISPRSVYELTRTGAIPCRRIAGTRRYLFLTDELDAWVDGSELELVETNGGGRVVRPKAAA